MVTGSRLRLFADTAISKLVCCFDHVFFFVIDGVDKKMAKWQNAKMKRRWEKSEYSENDIE